MPRAPLRRLNLAFSRPLAGTRGGLSATVGPKLALLGVTGGVRAVANRRSSSCYLDLVGDRFCRRGTCGFLRRAIHQQLGVRRSSCLRRNEAIRRRRCLRGF
uniref:(northern house mosquito) hypothetical protein n=1 Tax=Culex pipiens TaxID=7175 RepID=A0A8D8FUZ8_CULPI